MTGAGDSVAQGQNDPRDKHREDEKGQRWRRKRIVALQEKQKLRNDGNNKKGIQPWTVVHLCKVKAADAVHGAERRRRNQSPPAIVIGADDKTVKATMMNERPPNLQPDTV